MKQKRKAFTIIELVFIIIIGILAAISIPKLVANRDDASAAVCVNEVGQLIHEISNAYMKNPYEKFIQMHIDEISKLNTNISLTHGIHENASSKIHLTGVTYYCAGEEIVKLKGDTTGSRYLLKISEAHPVNPIGKKVLKILENIYNMTSDNGKVYKL